MTLTAESKKKLIAYWVKGSKIDFDAASEIVANTKRYSNAIFFMHLSVEKALKGLFVKKTSEPAPFSHNLLSLASKCGLELSSTLEKALLEINEYNLESRYPDEKFTLEKQATKKFADRQLAKTAEILEWISSQ